MRAAEKHGLESITWLARTHSNACNSTCMCDIVLVNGTLKWRSKRLLKQKISNQLSNVTHGEKIARNYIIIVQALKCKTTTKTSYSKLAQKKLPWQITLPPMHYFAKLSANQLGLRHSGRRRWANLERGCKEGNISIGPDYTCTIQMFYTHTLSPVNQGLSPR